MPNGMHASHDITQSFESFRFKKTRRNRTAVSAPTWGCHRRVSSKSSDLPKQPRQRNKDRAIQMILATFLG